MRFVTANQATAAKRRVYFHLVDATDGITAETGEGGGQPQISTNGATFTNTGIGTLTHIGSGRYYADLTQTAVATAGDTIQTRYKSANTAESPGDSVQVLAVDLDDAVRIGITALPNAAADASGGLPISDAGGLDLDAILADTATTIPGLIAALNNLSAAQVNAECDTAISDASLATAAALSVVDGIVDAILVDTDATIPALIAALNDLSAADVNAEVDTALSDYDGPTRAEATSDKDEIITRGDAAWTTGAGGSANDVYEIKGSYMLSGTTLNYVFWLEENGQRIGTISSPSIDILDKDASSISFSSTPSIVGTTMAKGSGTFSPTNNVPYAVEAKATYDSVEYTGVLPAGATSA